MRLFLYIDKGCEVQKNKEVYLKMPRNLSANSPLQSILLKHQLALERAIRQLAQAVGNRPPERERKLPAFFKISSTVAGMPMRRPQPMKVKNLEKRTGKSFRFRDKFEKCWMEKNKFCLIGMKIS